MIRFQSGKLFVEKTRKIDVFLDLETTGRYSPDYIRDYIFDCLEKVKGHGGIAFSSGNSIPDYVPTEGYLAMVNAVREWRGDRPAF